MRKAALLVPVIAIAAVLGYFVMTTPPKDDPLKTVDAAKMTALDTAGKKADKSERDSEIDKVIAEIQTDYDAAKSKPDFIKALNTRLEKLPSVTRIKDEADKLVRDADAKSPPPTGGTPSGGTPTGGTPVSTDPFKNMTIVVNALKVQKSAKVSVEQRNGLTVVVLTPECVDKTLNDDLLIMTQKNLDLDPELRSKGAKVEKIVGHEWEISKDGVERVDVLVDGKFTTGSTPLAPAGKQARVYVTLDSNWKSAKGVEQFSNRVVRQILDTNPGLHTGGVVIHSPRLDPSPLRITAK